MARPSQDDSLLPLIPWIEEEGSYHLVTLPQYLCDWPHHLKLHVRSEYRSPKCNLVKSYKLHIKMTPHNSKLFVILGQAEHPRPNNINQSFQVYLIRTLKSRTHETIAQVFCLGTKRSPNQNSMRTIGPPKISTHQDWNWSDLKQLTHGVYVQVIFLQLVLCLGKSFLELYIISTCSFKTLVV